MWHYSGTAAARQGGAGGPLPTRLHLQLLGWSASPRAWRRAPVPPRAEGYRIPACAAVLTPAQAGAQQGPGPALSRAEHRRRHRYPRCSPASLQFLPGWFIPLVSTSWTHRFIPSRTGPGRRSRKLIAAPAKLGVCVRGRCQHEWLGRIWLGKYGEQNLRKEAKQACHLCPKQS